MKAESDREKKSSVKRQKLTVCEGRERERERERKRERSSRVKRQQITVCDGGERERRERRERREEQQREAAAVKVPTEHYIRQSWSTGKTIKGVILVNEH